MNPRTLVIGLGNSILTDDGVGIAAARALRARLAHALGDDLAVVETEVGGFGLIETMAGWERVYLIDAVAFDGVPAGTLLRIDPGDLRTSLRIRSVHEIDLPTALELGRRLGLAMPRSLAIIAVQAQDCLTLGERLTPAVAAGCENAVEMVLRDLRPGMAALAH